MSRLFFSDAGRAGYANNEELSRWRRARKRLTLPEAVASGGTLFVCAHPHHGCERPLRLAVNGRELSVDADGRGALRWYRLPLDAGCLRPRENTIELWSDTPGLDGWVLGVEGRPANPNSMLSTDGGRTWQNERMGIRHDLRGEYLVRLRLHDPALADPPPPPFAPEAADCPQLAELRERIPAAVRCIPDRWERVRALSTWVSRQWRYRNDETGCEYAPWDALAILSWAGWSTDRHGRRPSPCACTTAWSSPRPRWRWAFLPGASAAPATWIRGGATSSARCGWSAGTSGAR